MSDLESKLKSVIDEARDQRIRLLIEVELSGKLYIFFDSHEKRNIIKMLRANRIINRKIFYAGEYDIRFPNTDAEYKFLGYNKGKKLIRLHRNRTLHRETVGNRSIYFFDISYEETQEYIKAIDSDFEKTVSNMKNINDKIFINYDKDVLLFYGK